MNKDKKNSDLYTSLNNNEDVVKCDIRIKVRGKIDTLISNIISFQIKYKDNEKVFEDLSSLYTVSKLIQRCEAMDTLIPEIEIMGLKEEEIRERSHYPLKYYNHDHLFNLDYTCGIITSDFDLLRTLTREIEILVVELYYLLKNENHLRMSVVLNRLNSAIYLMEIKYILK